MSNLARLRDEHARLIDILDLLSPMIMRPFAPQAADLHHLRRRLAETLICHLKTEDWVLYPNLLDSSDPVVVRTARAFSAEMGGLAATFMDYMQKWDQRAIEQDWPGYCRETADLAAVLRRRIERENSELYPLLELRLRVA